jgi:hypothetical protein
MEAARRVSAIHPEDGEEEYDEEQEDEQKPNFAERFLLGELSRSWVFVNADVKRTRRIHSTSTIYGSLQPLLRILLFSKMKMKRWKILPQPTDLTTTKHLNLHLASIPSRPTLPVNVASINNELSVETHYESPVVDSLVRGDSVLLLETSPPYLVTLAYTRQLVFNWEKMRVIRSLELHNPRGGHLRLVGLVLLLKEGPMSDLRWSALLMGWESPRSQCLLGNPCRS